MPKIFMLGNGFDMRYNLPTSYSNFLHTVAFLEKETVEPGDAVGTLFSKMNALNSDLSISYCFSQNPESYKAALFDYSDSYKINYIQEASKTNKWINYLKEQLIDNGKWVDFEQQIAKVVDSLQSFISGIDANADNHLYRISSSNILWAVSAAFSFDGDSYGKGYKNFREDLMIPAFPDSSRNMLDIKRIIHELWDSLKVLNQTLCFYLECFAEKPLSVMVEKGDVLLDNIFSKADAVVTFNYTNTFEKLYPCKKVCHVHGALPGSVVLGIDSNQYDESDSIDTSFIRFKKYFQRATLCTDTSYRELIWELEQNKKTSCDPEPVELRIVGHSLDKTDKEIIRELFAVADKIWVYFYKPENKEDYTRNLVSIYGRKAFEQIRKEKMLKYVSLDELNVVDS